MNEIEMEANWSPEVRIEEFERKVNKYLDGYDSGGCEPRLEVCLLYEAKNLVGMMKDLIQPKIDWIPVSEFIPPWKKGIFSRNVVKKYLVTLAHIESPLIAEFVNGKFRIEFFSDIGADVTKDVIAWAPLPSRYNGRKIER